MRKKGFFISILRRKELKPLDYLSILFACFLIVISSIYVYGSGEGRLYVHIKSSSREWLLPLDGVTKVIKVRGPLGITEVEIDKKSARIIESPCKNKICIRSGAISKPGQWIACLPNRVIVSIEGRKYGKTDNYVDAVNF